ncbi:hypothetical protein KQX54_006354 [Cotesia glomerata]|uniref:Uncharacterized protein n=1 Tax=Cotesia glomerata TaxID=32391 RepID=A0AAV7IQ97_COTGL|nr:hypothetical protein KQX54_006354 [Cotesia glomerata]
MYKKNRMKGVINKYRKRYCTTKHHRNVEEGYTLLYSERAQNADLGPINVALLWELEQHQLFDRNPKIETKLSTSSYPHNIELLSCLNGPLASSALDSQLEGVSIIQFQFWPIASTEPTEPT